MPKKKTHRGAAKRMRKTASGKVMRARAFMSHNYGKKSARHKRRLTPMVRVAKPDERNARDLLGG
ncbi:MAG: 50S ribosomal protein L35 [Actinomycetota bacterium]